MMVEGDMAAKIMGIIASGLILWVVLSNPSPGFAEADSGDLKNPPLPRSQIQAECISNSSTPGKQVCSPSSIPVEKG